MKLSMISSPSFRSNLRYSEWVMIVGVSLGFLLDVADDGQGFDPKLPHLGLGLQGIEERVQLLRGQLTINSTPGSGTQIQIILPL